MNSYGHSPFDASGRGAAANAMVRGSIRGGTDEQDPLDGEQFLYAGVQSAALVYSGRF